MVFLASLPPRVHIDLLSMMPTKSYAERADMNQLACIRTKPWKALPLPPVGGGIFKSLGFDVIELPVRPGFPGRARNISNATCQPR